MSVCAYTVDFVAKNSKWNIFLGQNSKISYPLILRSRHIGHVSFLKMMVWKNTRNLVISLHKKSGDYNAAQSSSVIYIINFKIKISCSDGIPWFYISLFQKLGHVSFPKIKVSKVGTIFETFSDLNHRGHNENWMFNDKISLVTRLVN